MKNNQDKAMKGKDYNISRVKNSKGKKLRTQHAFDKVVSQKTKSQSWTTKGDQSPS